MAWHFTEDASTVGSNRGRVSEDAPLVPPTRRFPTRKPVPSLTIFAIINVDYVWTRGNWRGRTTGRRGGNVEVLIFNRPIFGYLDYRWIVQTTPGVSFGNWSFIGIGSHWISTVEFNSRWLVARCGAISTVVPASRFPKSGKKFPTRCRPLVARFWNAITILHARHVRYRAVAWGGGD